jgi:excisionase family DNA binding protein
MVPAMSRPLPAATAPCRLYRVPEAMQLLSMSRTVLYEQIRSGRLRSVTQGRTRLIPADAIADYVALLVREAADDARTT